MVTAEKPCAWYPTAEKKPLPTIPTSDMTVSGSISGTFRVCSHTASVTPSFYIWRIRPENCANAC